MGSPEVEHRMLPLADGRRLEVGIAGPADGVPLLFHHGTPGSGRPVPPLLAAASDHGLRWVAPVRAGYGRSDRQAGRDVAAAAADAAAVLDHLGVDSAYVVGWSGGGPHALATAALVPERTRAVAVLAGVAPWDAGGLDVLAGMGEANIAEFAAAVDGEHALRPLLDAEADGLREVGEPDLVAALASLLPPVDVRCLEAGAGAWLAASFHAGLERGVDGWVDDDLAFVRPWGFALHEVAGTPVSVWQGGRDLMVPPAHGAWLATTLPHAQAHLLPDEGHLSLLERAGEIVAALVAAGR